jgi:putative methyltransferase (TIGR04325 family)
MKPKQVFKVVVPPVVMDLWKRQRRRFYGDFSSWQEARSQSAGYDADNIIERVRASLLAVKQGRAVYERDSVLFDEVLHPWPVLAQLLRCACLHDCSLNVADFGGSLGTHYFQCREFLSPLRSIRWNVIEQEKMVLCGREEFESEELFFYSSIRECFEETKPNVVLISGSLQYVQEPYRVLEQLYETGSTHLIIDRTGFIPGLRDRLVIQVVPSSIYEASYPAWFFGSEKFRQFLAPRYRISARFHPLDGDVYLQGGQKAHYEGLILERLPTRGSPEREPAGRGAARFQPR